MPIPWFVEVTPSHEQIVKLDLPLLFSTNYDQLLERARRPDSLTEDDKPRLTAILDRCPELQTASDQVRAFAGMLTELTGQDLPQWTADASDAGLPGISSFAKGLKQDLDAVTNGLTMPWSSGPVEGRDGHIKMIKRQMSGRAGLPLLRKK